MRGRILHRTKVIGRIGCQELLERLLGHLRRQTMEGNRIGSPHWRAELAERQHHQTKAVRMIGFLMPHYGVEAPIIGSAVGSVATF